MSARDTCTTTEPMPERIPTPSYRFVTLEDPPTLENDNVSTSFESQIIVQQPPTLPQNTPLSCSLEASGGNIDTEAPESGASGTAKAAQGRSTWLKEDHERSSTPITHGLRKKVIHAYDTDGSEEEPSLQQQDLHAAELSEDGESTNSDNLPPTPQLLNEDSIVPKANDQGIERLEKVPETMGLDAVQASDINVFVADTDQPTALQSQNGTVLQYSPPEWTVPHPVSPSPFKDKFKMVIHVSGDQTAIRMVQLDTGSSVDILSEDVVKELSLALQPYTGFIMPLGYGQRIRPLGKVTLQWHVMGKPKTYTTTFVVLDAASTRDFDALLSRGTIARVGFYKTDDNVWVLSQAGRPL